MQPRYYEREGMIEYSFQGEISKLKKDGKKEWAMGTLAADSYFCHGANKLTPARAETYGISPMYAQDVAVDELEQQIGSGKLVYAFRAEQAGQIHKPLSKHQFLWESSHYFVFMAPAGTKFWCKGGQIPVGTAEIAFPYIVEPDDIKFVYDKKYRPVAFAAKASPTANWGLKAGA